MRSKNNINTRLLLGQIGLFLFASSVAAQEISADAKDILEQHLSPAEVRLVLENLPDLTDRKTLGPLDPEKDQPFLGADSCTPIKSFKGTASVIYLSALRGREHSGGEIARELARLEANIQATVVVPSGRYIEFKLDIPDNVHLRAEDPDTIISAPSDFPAGEAGYLVSLGSNSSLNGFTLSGLRTRGYGEMCGPDQYILGRCKSISGIYLRERTTAAIVVNNHLINMPYGYGVMTSRAQTFGASYATVCHNTFTDIGRTGIHVGNAWTVANNRIVRAGVDSVSAGGGEEAILTAPRTSGSVLRNNLIVSVRDPRGRHALATQAGSKHVIASNVLVAHGGMRGILVLADGSDSNIVEGNLLIGAQSAEKRPNLGLHVFGKSNLIRQNFIFGSRRGLSSYSNAQIQSANNIFESNRGRVIERPEILVKSDQSRNNQIQRSSN